MTIEDPSLIVHGCQLLLLATSQSVNNYNKFDVSSIFSCVLFNVGGGELVTIEDPSLSALGYQLLPLATTQLVGNNTEFDISDIY